jgi:endonuclease/exonuclease/phosphatase family metal-dependent hydrolase
MKNLLCALLSCWLSVVLWCPALAELPPEIRVVTYNIHHGEGTGGKIDLERIANVMLAARPDIIAVQEVDQNTRRTKGVDQPAELARLTSMQVVFGRNIDFEGGGYGTAVLTNLPVRSHESVKLKSYYAPTKENPEQRGVQVLEIGENDGPGFLFLCTHLDYRPPDDERMNSALTINDVIKKRESTPAIIAGDFNATPDSRVIAEFKKKWTIAGDNASASQKATGLRTFPSSQPNRWIDYVMYRPPNRWECVEARVLEEPVASDHRPVLAVVRRLP